MSEALRIFVAVRAMYEIFIPRARVFDIRMSVYCTRSGEGAKIGALFVDFILTCEIRGFDGVDKCMKYLELDVYFCCYLTLVWDRILCIFPAICLQTQTELAVAVCNVSETKPV